MRERVRPDARGTGTPSSATSAHHGAGAGTVPRATRMGVIVSGSSDRMRDVKQRLASTRLADGTEIAYAAAGQGPLLVHAPGWLTHLEASWAMPVERAFYEMLARGRTLVRYDKPGCGLSGPTTRAPSLDLEVETLRT